MKVELDLCGGGENKSTDGEYLRAFNCYLADDVHADKMSTNSDIDPVVIRKNWRYNGVIRSRKSRDRQCNHPQKKDKGTITEILLKVALNAITLTLTSSYR
jgi:hypothetical protein